MNINETLESSNYIFSNQREAERFARAQGGPILIDVTHPDRGVWIVTITEKEVK